MTVVAMSMRWLMHAVDVAAAAAAAVTAVYIESIGRLRGSRRKFRVINHDHSHTHTLLMDVSLAVTFFRRWTHCDCLLMITDCLLYCIVCYEWSNSRWYCLSLQGFRIEATVCTVGIATVQE